MAESMTIGAAGYRTTRWSRVLEAATDGEEGRAALGWLYRVYWQPVYSFIARRRGAQAAAELTQQFFYERLVAGRDLRRLERRPGQRFRGWLVTALLSFLKTQWRYEHRKMRDSSRTVFLPGSERGEDSAHAVVPFAREPDPEQQLGRARALALLTEVLGRLRRDYCVNAAKAGVNGDARFDALKVFLQAPSAEHGDYASHAAALGMTPDAVKQAVRRLRLRFGELLDEALTERAGAPIDLGAARRSLLESLESPAPQGED
jgi:DNA-directed RNA polymerase specialized sigma24 family protein